MKHLLQEKSYSVTSAELQDSAIQKASKRHCLETEGRLDDFEGHWFLYKSGQFN